MVRVAPVRIVRRNVRDERAHGRCRPVDAQNAPTATWKTAQNAVSHSAHTHPRFHWKKRTEDRTLRRQPAPHTKFLTLPGIPPRPRRRSRLALTATEREEISRQLACGHSLRAISQSLGRAPSTLTREVARNGGRSLYRAAVADGQAWRRARRPQRCRLSTHPALRRIVALKLAEQWPPHQIAGWLR